MRHLTRLRAWLREHQEPTQVCAKCGYPLGAMAMRYETFLGTYCQPCERWFISGKPMIMSGKSPLR